MLPGPAPKENDKFPSNKTYYEIPIAIQDRSFNADGSLFYPDSRELILVRDWRDVHEVLKPYTKVTNIHGHVHQVLYNEIGTLRSIGMLATSWPWPCRSRSER